MLEQDVPAKRYLSPQEFCRLTGWSASTVRRRLKDGSLPAIQPGGRRALWLIDVEAFQAGHGPAQVAELQAAPSNSKSTVDQEADATSSARLPGPRPGWLQGR